MASGSTLHKDGHALSTVRQAVPIGGMAGGVALLAYGVARRSWATVGVGASLAGSSLAYRARVHERSLAEALERYASQRQHSSVAVPRKKGVKIVRAVTINLKYDPPAGKVGIAVAKLFNRDAEAEVREDLRHLKQLLEAGEVPTTRGQPAGGRRSRITPARGRPTKLRFKLL